MDDFVLDPTKNFTPRQNPPKQTVVEQKVFIPDMTDDQLRKLARERLSEALQSVSATLQPEMTRKLCAELMDRLDGKPGQQLQIDHEIRQITVNAKIEFVGANELITINNDDKSIG